MDGVTFTIVLPDEVIAVIAERAAAQVQVQPTMVSPYMTVPEAAEFLCCSRQRIYDLLTARRLSRHKEGSRTLILRSALEQHVREER